MSWLLLTFFLGASVGSFVNVLIDRSVAGEDWVAGRSHCDHCGKQLSWYEMLPIISYLWLGARSRCCRTPLTYRYPLVEGLTGMLFVWWLGMGFLFFQLSSAPLTVIQPAFWLVTGIMVLILALADWFYGVVLMPVVYVGWVSVAIYRLTLWGFGVYQTGDLTATLMMTILAYGFFWMLHKLTRGRGMADGDMYVAAYVAMVVGWPRGMVSLGLSFVIGAVVGVILILFGMKKRTDTLPFVPFMMIALVIVLLWGEQISRFLS